MKTLLLATTNPGKLAEFKQAFKRLNFKLVTPESVGIPKSFKVKESGKTLAENAKLKAQAFGLKTNLLTLADDTGLVVKALNNRPGVYSARYGPTAKKRNQRLLKELKGITDRRAQFKTVIAIYDPKSKKLFTCTGTTSGKILLKPSGHQGFGYDPLFYSNELHRSFAEVSLKEKNRVSHRGRAIKKAIDKLTKLDA